VIREQSFAFVQKLINWRANECGERDPLCPELYAAMEGFLGYGEVPFEFDLDMVVNSIRCEYFLPGGGNWYEARRGVQRLRRLATYLQEVGVELEKSLAEPEKLVNLEIDKIEKKMEKKEG
jgi:hypothetical protein